MRRTSIAVAICSILAAWLVGSPTATAAATDGTDGLWPSGFNAGQSASACGKWKLNDSGFCKADDTRNGLEVGVRFQTSRDLQITGVRIYRVDPGTVKGSLWDSAGTLLARGTFGPQRNDGWQDLTFAAPVTVSPGVTYVASYFTPGTKYAFDYGYYASAARTVGPVTALQATAAEPNGVHCYDDAPCESFPVRPFRSTNYWVTPLWQEIAGATPPATEAPATEGPRVVRAKPAAGATRVGLGSRVRAKFSAPLDEATVSSATVLLVRRGDSTPVPSSVTYDAGRGRVVLRPLTALRRASTYRVKITTQVRDRAGTALDQNPSKPGSQAARWTFRTR